MEAILFTATGTLTALLAGVFFGFSVAVNGGLHRLRDVEYVRAMQSINRVIQNPLFFLSFMGPVVLLPIVTFMTTGMAFTLLAVASALYVFIVFGLTVAGNVPLNNTLDRVQTTDERTAAAARTAYEQPWNRLHNIRTVAAIAVTVLIFVAYLVK